MFFRALIFCVILLPVGLHAGGRLQQIVDDAQKGVPAAAVSPSPTRSPTPCHDSFGNVSPCPETQSDWSWLWYVVATPYLLPPFFAGDTWDDHRVWLAGSDTPENFALKVSADISDHDKILMQSLSVSGAYKRLELAWVGTRLEESLPGGAKDYLNLAKFDVMLRFVNMPHFRMHSGIGMRGLFDTNRNVSLGGIDFCYGMEANRGLLVGRIDTSIGNIAHSLALELKATLGITLGTFELYGGYQNLDLNGTGLGGPLMGLQASF